ncbi:MAG: Smr/MutS family protein [Streptococcus sp.]
MPKLKPNNLRRNRLTWLKSQEDIWRSSCPSRPSWKRYEEAMQELDAFIDQALLNNMSQVDIIHGIGTGVIRDAVTKYLRRHRHVKSFEYAPQSAGGSGCTIATLG